MFPLPHIVLVLPFMFWASGMALFPFILVNDPAFKKDKALLNHEKIHLMQQLELLIVPFYVLYVLNFLVNWFKYKNAQKAYLNMYFEREAFANDHNLDYLKTRKAFNFLAYISAKNKIDFF